MGECTECGSNDLVIDEEREEFVCVVCGCIGIGEKSCTRCGVKLNVDEIAHGSDLCGICLGPYIKQRLLDRDGDYYTINVDIVVRAGSISAAREDILNLIAQRLPVKYRINGAAIGDAIG